MVERFCFVRLHEDSPDGREIVAAHLRSVLTGIDGVFSVSSGVPADESAASWDVSLVVRCGDLEGWYAVAKVEAVRELFEEWLVARAKVIKAWTFVSEIA